MLSAQGNDDSYENFTSGSKRKDAALMLLSTGSYSSQGARMQSFYLAWSKICEAERRLLAQYVKRRMLETFLTWYEPMINAFKEWDDLQKRGAPGFDCKCEIDYLLLSSAKEEIDKLISKTPLIWREFHEKILRDPKYQRKRNAEKSEHQVTDAPFNKPRETTPSKETSESKSKDGVKADMKLSSLAWNQVKHMENDNILSSQVDQLSSKIESVTVDTPEQISKEESEIGVIAETLWKKNPENFPLNQASPQKLNLALSIDNNPGTESPNSLENETGSLSGSSSSSFSD